MFDNTASLSTPNNTSMPFIPLYTANILLRLLPGLSLLLFLSVALIHACFPSKTRSVSTTSRVTQRRLLWGSWTVCFSFILEFVLLLQHGGSSQSHALPSEGANFYALCYIFLWFWTNVLQLELSNPPWPAFATLWASTAMFDTAYVVLGLHAASPRGSPWALTLFVIRTVRIALIVAMLLYALLSTAGRHDDVGTKTDEETRGLLDDDGDDEAPKQPMTYGAFTTANAAADSSDDGEGDGNDDDEDDDDKEIMELQKKRLQEQGGWLGYLRGFLVFLPYILPYKDRFTQAWLTVLLTCVVVERFLTILIPWQLGVITEALGETPTTGIVPWRDIMVWGALQFPIASVTDLLKERAKTRVSQFARRELKAAAFAHVMALSMDYHTSKSSGKLTKAIEQGTELSSLVDNVLTAGPMLVDLAVAAAYMTGRFDFYLGFVVLGAALGALYSTLKGSAITFPLERASSERSRLESEVLYDSVSNWPTVAYHNRRRFEQDRYGAAVRAEVMAQRTYFDWCDLDFAAQGLAMDAGLLVAAGLVARRLAAGEASLSAFVFLVSYWASLRQPMHELAWTFRETSAHLINAEWLFQLLQTVPSVRDRPDAAELRVPDGRVEFRDVSFAYDPKRPILRGLSFVAEPGQSVALVGETGGGKSTILKLLYRFYDVTPDGRGAIAIDGQDLRDVTLDSLREHLGTVPQEPSVFDQTILQNVAYARPGATREDVVDACRKARIHDQIMRFPEAYETRLGERGVRLSGGELQRLAIARVILRKPRVVILDEATSAVDSDTEANVQLALAALGAGRTVFTVAHRLSTIVAANLILVIDQGRVVERGTHQELLQKQGKYYRLWMRQTASQSDESEKTDTDAGGEGDEMETAVGSVTKVYDEQDTEHGEASVGKN